MNLLKYEEFIEKLRESPKKYRDVIKNEYDNWVKREIVYRSLTNAFTAIALGIANINPIYGLIVLAITLTCYLVALSKLERNLSMLRELLTGNCTVSPMNWREVFERDILTIGWFIAVTIILILMLLGP